MALHGGPHVSSEERQATEMTSRAPGAALSSEQEDLQATSVASRGAGGGGGGRERNEVGRARVVGLGSWITSSRWNTD